VHSIEPLARQNTLIDITGQLTDQKGKKLQGTDLRVFTFHWGSTSWIEIMTQPNRTLCTNNDVIYKILVYVPMEDETEADRLFEPSRDDTIWDPVSYKVKYEGDDTHTGSENGIVISPEV